MTGVCRRLRYDERNKNALKIGLVIVIAACTRIAAIASAALGGIVDVDTDAAVAIDHLDAIEFAAIVLETFGAEYLAARLAFDPAHRIGQFRPAAVGRRRIAALTVAIVVAAVALLLLLRYGLGERMPGRASGEGDQHG